MGEERLLRLKRPEKRELERVKEKQRFEELAEGTVVAKE